MKTILVVILVLCGFIGAFSQEKVIQKEVFDEVSKTSSDIFKTRPFRVLMTTESQVNGKPQERRVSKTTIEVNTDKRHFVNELTSNEKSTKSEYIQIGEKAYARENDEQWKETSVVNRRTLKTIDEQVEYKSLGTETVNGQILNVYLKTSKSKRIDESNNNQEVLSEESVKYWFAKDGALLKRETRRENHVGALIFNFHTVSRFEYDQNIQILAPKI